MSKDPAKNEGSMKIRPQMLCTTLVQQMVDDSKKHGSHTLQTEIVT